MHRPCLGVSTRGVVFPQNFACAVSQKVRDFTPLPLMLMNPGTTAPAT
jgi:hypothetical protein